MHMYIHGYCCVAPLDGRGREHESLSWDLAHFFISLAILPKIPDCCVGFFGMRGANGIFLVVFFFIHTVIFICHPLVQNKLVYNKYSTIKLVYN